MYCLLEPICYDELGGFKPCTHTSVQFRLFTDISGPELQYYSLQQLCSQLSQPLFASWVFVDNVIMVYSVSDVSFLGASQQLSFSSLIRQTGLFRETNVVGESSFWNYVSTKQKSFSFCQIPVVWKTVFFSGQFPITDQLQCRHLSAYSIYLTSLTIW